MYYKPDPAYIEVTTCLYSLTCLHAVLALIPITFLKTIFLQNYLAIAT